MGGKRKRRCAKYSDSPAVLKKREDVEQRRLDREAETWLRRDTQRRQKEHERAEGTRIRQRERERRSEARMIAKADKARNRSIEAYLSHGMTRAEAEHLADREPSYESIDPGPLGPGFNPGQRVRLALDFLHGGRSHARRNPSCTTCEAARDASQAFHGEPHETRGGKVVVGQLEQIGYRAPARSSRAGLWVHEAGDTGIPFMRNRGRARILADPRTGAVSLDTKGSGLRWSRARGLVG